MNVTTNIEFIKSLREDIGKIVPIRAVRQQDVAERESGEIFSLQPKTSHLFIVGSARETKFIYNGLNLPFMFGEALFKMAPFLVTQFIL